MKISAVLPIYNGDKYINFSLPTILSNLDVNDELIVVNNGSTDNTEQSLKKWARLDKRINLISLKEPGLVNALNLGLSESSNEWIARFDIDDIYPTNRISEQRRLISPDYVAIFTDYEFISSSNLPLGYVPSAILPAAVSLSLVTSQRTPHPSVLYSKSAVMNVGGYRNIDFPAEDLSLWLRLSKIGKLTSVPLNLLKYRISPGSITSRNQDAITSLTRKLMNTIGLNLDDLSTVVNNYKEFTQSYSVYPESNLRKLLLLRDLFYARKYLVINDNTLLTEINRLISAEILKTSLNPTNINIVLSTLKMRQKRQIYRGRIYEL